MRMMTAEEERRLTLLEQQVGGLLAGRERMSERIRKLREFIDFNCEHTAHISPDGLTTEPCRVCKFLTEDAK